MHYLISILFICGPRFLLDSSEIIAFECPLGVGAELEQMFPTKCMSSWSLSLHVLLSPFDTFPPPVEPVELPPDRALVTLLDRRGEHPPEQTVVDESPACSGP